MLTDSVDSLLDVTVEDLQGACLGAVLRSDLKDDIPINCCGLQDLNHRLRSRGWSAAQQL